MIVTREAELEAAKQEVTQYKFSAETYETEAALCSEKPEMSALVAELEEAKVRRLALERELQALREQQSGMQRTLDDLYELCAEFKETYAEVDEEAHQLQDQVADEIAAEEESRPTNSTELGAANTLFLEDAVASELETKTMVSTEVPVLETSVAALRSEKADKSDLTAVLQEGKTQQPNCTDGECLNQEDSDLSEQLDTTQLNSTRDLEVAK